MCCKQLCKELHNTFAEKGTCLHVLIFIILFVSVVIFTVSLLSVLRTGGSLEMYIFLGVIGLVMLLLMAAFIAILYFQCCKKKSVSTAVGATAPVIQEGSFSGINPLRPQAASTR